MDVSQMPADADNNHSWKKQIIIYSILTSILLETIAYNTFEVNLTRLLLFDYLNWSSGNILEIWYIFQGEHESNNIRIHLLIHVGVQLVLMVIFAIIISSVYSRFSIRFYILFDWIYIVYSNYRWFNVNMLH